MGDTTERVEADALAMLTAATIQADLFITDRILPHALGHDPWSRVTVLNPQDALPVLGLYLRHQRRFILGRSPKLGDPPLRSPHESMRDRNYFYWEAANLLLPDAWRWRIASEAYARATGDETLWLLQTAVVQRVDQTLQSRDRLLVATSVAQNMDTADDVLNELDQVLVWLMAAFDSAARLVHITLDVDGEIRYAGWRNTRWLGNLREKTSSLAGLVSGASPGKQLLIILALLRNYIHGPALSATGFVPVIGENALETFAALPGAERDQILAATENLGGLEVWGLKSPLTGYDLYLVPGTFVEQLIPRAIRLLGQIMQITPVEHLEGVETPEGLRSGSIPLSLYDKRILWQLGLQET